MPVPGILKPDHSITGHAVRFSNGASLDRFIKKVMKNILLMPKWSRLAKKLGRSGFQMVKTKWPPFWQPSCFYHSKTGLFHPDFKWSTSLDHFGMNKKNFITPFLL
jgi:hypothetical protein